MIMVVLVAAVPLLVYTQEFPEQEELDLESTKMGESSTQDIVAVIPKDKLLPRLESEWLSQYDSLEEFESIQSTIKSYVTTELPNNGWNQAMVKEQIVIQNFDTIIGKRGHGHEIVALFVAKQKILGVYDASDEVKKYHKWSAAQTTIPTTLNKIDQRIGELVGNDTIHLVPAAVEAYNNMAAHGAIPHDLREMDISYWAMITNMSICSYDPTCDPETIQRLHANTAGMSENDIVSNSTML